jgi:hypothetical protein
VRKGVMVGPRDCTGMSDFRFQISDFRLEDRASGVFYFAICNLQFAI